MDNTNNVQFSLLAGAAEKKTKDEETLPQPMMGNGIITEEQQMLLASTSYFDDPLPVKG